MIPTKQGQSVKSTTNNQQPITNTQQSSFTTQNTKQQKIAHFLVVWSIFCSDLGFYKIEIVFCANDLEISRNYIPISVKS